MISFLVKDNQDNLDKMDINNQFEKIFQKNYNILSKITKFLDKYRINLNEISIFGGVKLIHYVVKENLSELIPLFVKHYIDVNAMDARGMTAIHYAVLRDNNAIPLLKILVQHGANLNKKTLSEGNTLGHLAVKHNPQLLKTLAEMKADLNSTNYLGETPAYLAAKVGSFETLAILDEAGVDLTLPSANQFTPYEIVPKTIHYTKAFNFLLSLNQAKGIKSESVQNYHKTIMNMMKIAGFSGTDKGVCNGILLSLAFSFLTGTLSDTISRIKQLPSYETTFAEDLKEFYSKSDEKSVDYSTKRLKTIKAEIQPHLEHMYSLQSPNLFKSILSKRFIAQTNGESVWSLVESIAMQKLGGASYSKFRWFGIYNIYQLENYIALLQKLVHTQTMNIAFEMYRYDHTIGIAYCSKQNQWWFMNSNNKLEPALAVPVDFLPVMIYGALQSNPSVNSSVIISTNPICLTIHKLKMDALFENFVSTSEFKDLHEINYQNAKLKTDKDSLAHMAAKMGKSHELKLLAQCGADLNFISSNTSSPLFCATTNQFEDCVRILLENKVDVNQTTQNAEAALYSAVITGNANILKLLVTARANVNLLSNRRTTFLGHATEKGYLDCMKLLIAANANLDQVNFDGDTALILAVYYNRTTELQLLLDSKADPNIVPSKDNKTAIYWAMKKNHHECFNILLEKNRELAVIPIDKRTPLEWSIINCNSYACQKLINLNALTDTANDKVLKSLNESKMNSLNTLSAHVVVSLFKYVSSKPSSNDYSSEQYTRYISDISCNTVCEYIGDCNNAEEIAACFYRRSMLI